MSCTRGEKVREDQLIFKKGNNAGHRLGGDIIQSLPENTLEVLNAAFLSNVHKHKTFKYWEFDVRETKDGELVVHHDRFIKPGKAIDKITFNEVRSYLLKKCCQIPTLAEVMNIFVEKKFKGKVVVETKLLLSDQGRQQFIDITESYRGKGFKIAYLAFEKAFEKSFGEKKARWCRHLKKVMRAKKHKVNLCK